MLDQMNCERQATTSQHDTLTWSSLSLDESFFSTCLKTLFIPGCYLPKLHGRPVIQFLAPTIKNLLHITKVHTSLLPFHPIRPSLNIQTNQFTTLCPKPLLPILIKRPLRKPIVRTNKHTLFLTPLLLNLLLSAPTQINTPFIRPVLPHRSQNLRHRTLRTTLKRAPRSASPAIPCSCFPDKYVPRPEASKMRPGFAGVLEAHSSGFLSLAAERSEPKCSTPFFAP